MPLPKRFTRSSAEKARDLVSVQWGLAKPLTVERVANDRREARAKRKRYAARKAVL